MRIQIVSCSNEKAWYSGSIGKEFETYGKAFEYGERGNVVYFLKDVNGFCFVKQEDANLI